MSTALEQVLERLALDPHLRRTLKTHPADVPGLADLPEHERLALLQQDDAGLRAALGEPLAAPQPVGELER